MLAHNIKIALFGLLFSPLFFGSVVSTSYGQTITPSQRYQPTKVNPPQAHTPPARAQRIPTSFNFTDETAPVPKYPVQQVAYQQPVAAPTVPAILAGQQAKTKSQPTPPAAVLQQTLPKQTETPAEFSSALRKPHVPKDVSDFAPQMAQAIKSSQPRIAPDEISSQRATLESQLSKIKARQAEKKQAAATANHAAPSQQGGAFPLPPQSTQIAKPAGSSSNVARASYAEGPQPLRGGNANEATNDGKVRLVSSYSDTQSTPEGKAAIRLGAPSIEVETFGPRTIGINKPANYEVVVKNNSNSAAERILVGIDMPQWVDVQNINLTTGNKEITDGQDKARIIWTIDRIEAGKTQTATVLAVARKAEIFDVGVEWTLVPRAGKASIQVTEPRLTMSISGPQDVEFGEVARYLVTVRNPGTGTAENVTVKLPEALGGERSVIGDIGAGDEEIFQVELLARTAGELSLVAHATADGDVQTSSERQITVRRANLAVSIEGPAMKFSGDVGEYTIVMTNDGDAAANKLVAAVALPPGAKYVSGIESVTPIGDGVRWQVGPLEPGQTRTFKVECQLNGSGDLQLECGIKQGDLAASAACVTRVETVADLVLDVEDPRGPLPTNKNVPYIIKVRNRGSRAAKGIDLKMQFSEGIEPNSANGLKHRIVPGQVLFNAIPVIEPGQEVSVEVTAAAHQHGTHIFRAELTCKDSDSREISEGTTRFFNSNGASTHGSATANAADAKIDHGGDFKR